MIQPSHCPRCHDLSVRLADLRLERDRLEEALVAYIQAHELTTRRAAPELISLAFDRGRTLALAAWNYTDDQ